MGSMSFCRMSAGEKRVKGNIGERRTNGMGNTGGRLPWSRGEGKLEAWVCGKKHCCRSDLFLRLDVSVSRTKAKGHTEDLKAWSSGELALEWSHLLFIYSFTEGWMCVWLVRQWDGKVSTLQLKVLAWPWVIHWTPLNPFSCL